MPANRKRAAAGKVAAAKRGRRAAANPIHNAPPPRLPSTRVNRGQHRRNLINNNDQHAGADDAHAARLAEAQEEETCLCDKEEQAAREEEEEQQQDAKLTATLARVAQLKAQKAERNAQQGTTATAVLPAIEGPQSQATMGSSALLIGEPQSQATVGSSAMVIRGPQSQNTVVLRQGENSLVSVELFERYPAIDKMHLKAIKKNTFKPINVVKLTTDLVLDRSKVKILAVGSDVALEAREEDAALGELKGLSHLICCFLIYMNILLHFTQNSLE